MVGASGAKATVLPVIIVGALLYVALHILIRRSVPVNMLLTAVLGVLVFAATYRVSTQGPRPTSSSRRSCG